MSFLQGSFTYGRLFVDGVEQQLGNSKLSHEGLTLRNVKDDDNDLLKQWAELESRGKGNNTDHNEEGFSQSERWAYVLRDGRSQSRSSGCLLSESLASYKMNETNQF